MPDQKGEMPKGGTMRLGAYPCLIREGTLFADVYRDVLQPDGMISERHRHRYEVNNDFREQLVEAGMVVAGTSPDNRLVEAIELPSQDFFIGVQFHPEFKSRPNKPHPLFASFIAASCRQQNA